ncbi:MAG: hypothetical protein ACK5IN_09430 [Microbacterium sp.]
MTWNDTAVRHLLDNVSRPARVPLVPVAKAERIPPARAAPAPWPRP